MATRQRRTQFAAAALAASFVIASADADVINVSAGQSIQAAVNVAVNGDEIIVGPGTYFQLVDMKGKEITLRSSDGPATTIIDATNLFDPVIKCITGETANTVIQGFTITGGEATDAAPNERGGGLYCNVSSPTVIDCVFDGNTATIGGAFYANAGAPNFFDCEFKNNSSSGSGGAAYLNNTIVNFTDCTFDNNESTGSIGGAIRSTNARGAYTRCLFSGNTAASNGGAIDSANGSAYIESFFDCVFSGNAAGGKGGAFQVGTNVGDGPQFYNCVFENNTADGNGGAMHLESGAEATVYNGTFYGNVTLGGGGGGAIYETGGGVSDVRNTIAWGNTPNGFHPGVGAFYCNVQNDMGGTNISADPLFVDGPNGDYRLTSASPSIDAGDALLLPSTIDMDHDALDRMVNGGAITPTGVEVYGYFIDQGAFEYQPIAAPSGFAGDLTGDGVIDGADLAGLLAGWGACP